MRISFGILFFNLLFISSFCFSASNDISGNSTANSSTASSGSQTTSINSAGGSSSASSSSLLTNEEKLIRERAHQRAYPGGNDEEPLKVQAQLPSASRKMQPAQEPIEIAEPAENHANDSND